MSRFYSLGLPHALRGRARPEHMEVDSGASSSSSGATRMMPLHEFFQWQSSLPGNAYTNPMGPVAPPEGTRAHEDWKGHQNWVDRNLDPDSDIYKTVIAHTEHHGLHCRLEIPALDSEEYKVLYYQEIDVEVYPEDEYKRTVDVFEGKKRKVWGQRWNNDKNKWDWIEIDRPLLMIKTRPLQHFIHRIGRRVQQSDVDWDYHISLCFTNELHRFDLRNDDNGVRLGKATYNRLREQFNGKECILKGHQQKDMFVVDKITMLPNNVDINMPEEAVMLHNAGSYADREYHVSM